MRRYFFDFRDSRGVAVDDLEVELADEAAARKEVVRGLIEMARDAAPGTSASYVISAHVRDDGGATFDCQLTVELSVR